MIITGTGNYHPVIAQVDADYRLQDMKKSYKELELKGKGYKKKLDDLQNALLHHMEQYADLWLSHLFFLALYFL